ncbi:exosortase F system-associated protein [Christiangramia fulva]|uniref:Exosortase F system-associated protein n=1 Tax=Christiangramia fulva TaxID=2126553 RepID=A0A2R3Z1Z3_9FLAO|nr:exosortase F system-associated protein [Christiangramia fulva]AVR44301.1 exosortase F system-associated protein [Christiangramia fulva]
MEKKVKRRYRIVQIGALVLCLAAIRLFEDGLFYDPLIRFFKSDYLLGEIPEYHLGKLLLNLFIRFMLNTLISLAIIYLAFRDIQILRFSALLYAILLVAGFIVFTFLLINIEHEHYLALFYVRRFLIHPLFILILLPAFYYYRLRSYK